MFNWLTRKKISPIHVAPGDTVKVTYTDKNGKSLELEETPIESSITINDIAIGEFEDEFEMKNGLVAVMGESNV